MSLEPVQWYPSKIDWWLAPLLCLPPAGVILVCVISAVTGEMSAMLVGLVAAVVIAGVYLGLVFPMRYGMDDTHLIVRFGLCRQRVPLADIREVHPTHNPLSSPALSLDRLRVQYGPGFFKAVMISPANRNAFLNELADKAGLERIGDRLVRE
jgi:hypothetical protein